jgi:hypothetical protein
MVFTPVSVSGISYEELNESYSHSKVTTDSLQEIIHNWLNNEHLSPEEYDIEIVKDVKTAYGNVSYFSLTKTSGEPIDTNDLIIVTFNPNARGNKTRVILPDVTNTKTLSFAGTSPFWNRGNFPTTGQSLGDFIFKPGMTIIADEFSVYDGAIWNPDVGEYVPDADGHMTGMQAMFADWGNDPSDPSDDSLQSGDVVSVMLIDSSKNEIVFEKEVIVSGYPKQPIRLTEGKANFNMSSSLDDGLITLEYLGGTSVYPENIAIEVSHGLPLMNGFFDEDAISYASNSPLLPGDIINISFENWVYDSNSQVQGVLLDCQVVCAGEVFRLSVIDTSSNEVLDSELLIMGGGVLPDIVEKDALTSKELQTWLHHWVNHFPEPHFSPSADFHIELHKDVDTEYGNLSYLSIQQTAGDVIHTKDLKIITTNPNARGLNKTMEILPAVNNTNTLAFTGVSPFLNIGNFPTTGQFFGEFVMEPGITIVADEYANYDGATWNSDEGDYELDPDGHQTAMQAMFADWGDDPATPSDDSLFSGDSVNIKIVYTPTNKNLFDDNITVNEDTESNYPYLVSDFDGDVSLIGNNITFVYEGGYPVYIEQLKVICMTGEPTLVETIDKSEIDFYLSDPLYYDVGIDKHLLDQGDVIEIGFSTLEDSNSGNGRFMLGDLVLNEGDIVTFMLIDTDTGQIINVQELEMSE